ncbi:ribosome maturation factor RimP [Oenococcus alcoholitolerans]|uniref:ribosome maturation factor RimP n=1 Tax=Oenococcus alcoholitolerans TaxID=931074 RepID=UPI003F7123E5
MNSKTLNIIKEHILPILSQEELVLWKIDFSQHGQAILSIDIDLADGQAITIDKIAEVTPLISEALDEIKPDPFPDQYSLDISSPGINRELGNQEQLKWAIGKPVTVKFFEKVDGTKVVNGILDDFNEQQIQLKFPSDEHISYGTSKIAKISLNEED